MTVLTDLTRMRLTRSVKPFIFRNEYDQILPYKDCDHIGLYVHIPFCRSICSFCPYCKVIYEKQLCDEYVNALLDEIRIIGSQNTQKKTVTSLYFGGGTPALAAGRIREIIETLREYFVITEGIGIELHPLDVNEPMLKILKDAGITKLSIGIQSFLDRFCGILGRENTDPEKLKSILDEVHFETVSMDLIFALPSQTIDDLKKDIDTAFASGANHAAIYPFIDFTFTKNTVKTMEKDEKRKLLDDITRYCFDKGYARTSIWTFTNEKNASYSSMTRDNYLGFGCSAATLLRDQFKINTFSVRDYCERIREGKLPTSLTIRFTERQRMVYWLFWKLYSTELDPKEFEDFFGISLEMMYGTELKAAQKLGFLYRRNDGIYNMTLKGAFYYHYYENYYTLAYIDKMWGIMKEQAFPEKLVL